MNSLVVVFFCVVATAAAGEYGLSFGQGGGYASNPEAHIPSGFVKVGANGVVVAGPSGSIRTNNGLYGHGAGANIAGPSGDIRTQKGFAVLSGPGKGYGGDGGYYGGGSDGAGYGGGFGYGHDGSGGYGGLQGGLGHGLSGHGYQGW